MTKLLNSLIVVLFSLITVDAQGHKGDARLPGDPIYWEAYRKKHGVKFRRCKHLHGIAPETGDVCYKNAIGDYFCLFGDQECSDGSHHPTTWCDCELNEDKTNRHWQCREHLPEECKEAKYKEHVEQVKAKKLAGGGKKKKATKKIQPGIEDQDEYDDYDADDYDEDGDYDEDDYDEDDYDIDDDEDDEDFDPDEYFGDEIKFDQEGVLEDMDEDEEDGDDQDEAVEEEEGDPQDELVDDGEEEFCNGNDLIEGKVTTAETVKKAKKMAVREWLKAVKDLMPLEPEQANWGLAELSEFECHRKSGMIRCKAFGIPCANGDEYDEGESN